MKLKRISGKFILSYVAVLAVVFLALIGVFELSFRLSMKDYIRSNSYAAQQELDAGVTGVINEGAYLYGRIMSSANVGYLNAVADETLDMSRRRERFAALADRIGVDEEYFNDVVFVIGEDRFSINGSVPPYESEYEILFSRQNEMLLVGVSRGCVIMGIMSASGVSQFNGVMLFYFKESAISGTCNPAGGEEGYSFIMLSDGYIISHVDSGLVGKYIVYSDVYNPSDSPEYKYEVLDGKLSIIVTGKPQLLNSRYGFDCNLVSVFDYDYYFGGMDLTFNIVLGVSVGVLAAGAFFAVWRAHRISKPIRRLSESINATAEPTGAHVSVLPDGDELVQLERNYDAMMDRIFELVEKNKEDMSRQRRLELESLQMQINPHFLYNTLDAISWMARIKKQPEIDRLVMNLAKFFRLFLHGGDKFVTVADEVGMVLSYLEIDKIRFPDRVTVHTEIDEDVKDLLTLKLILQPVIENSLKYAFAEKHGNLYIRSFAEGGDIIFEVEDDGAGFDVPEGLLTGRPNKEGGYGLKNVNERIRLQYGEGYGLSVTSRKGHGTKVRIKVKKQ